MCTFVYVSRRLPGSIAEFIVKGGEEAVLHDITSSNQPELHFARFEDEYIASLLVEALDTRGIKAPAQSFVEGKLQATENHLEDMRKLMKVVKKT